MFEPLGRSLQMHRVHRPSVSPAAPAARPALRGVSAARRGLLRLHATYSITLQLPDGSETTIPCSDDTTILEASDQAGIDFPYRFLPCRAGTCSTCCAKVISGKVDNSEQVFLTQEQVAKGFALICCAYPESDCTVLTHQEGQLLL